jgi:hypothetical protein
VAQAPPAAEQQGHHDEHEAAHAVVRRRQRRRQLAPHQPEHAVALEPPPHEVEAGVRGQPGSLVSQRQGPVDPRPQFRFSSSHRRWPFVGVGSVAWLHRFYHTGRPFLLLPASHLVDFFVTSS